jgi:alpha-aminoadipate carrier protein LysW
MSGPAAGGLMAQCPECEALIEMDGDEVEEGELVSCPECGVDLEVISSNPVELRLAEDEDLEDDDEDEEDDDEDLMDDDDEDDYDE